MISRPLQRPPRLPVGPRVELLRRQPGGPARGPLPRRPRPQPAGARLQGGPRLRQAGRDRRGELRHLPGRQRRQGRQEVRCLGRREQEGVQGGELIENY